MDKKTDRNKINEEKEKIVENPRGNERERAKFEAYKTKKVPFS